MADKNWFTGFNDWMNNAGQNSYIGQFKAVNNAAGRWDAGMGMGLSALSGATGLLSNYQQASRINEDPQFDASLANLNAIGSGNYSSLGEIVSAYNNSNLNYNIDYDNVRGMTNGQKALSVGSSALTGAMTGASIGGPWGALAGGVIGLGSGLAGVLTGDANAVAQVNYQNYLKSQAEEAARKNLQATTENIQGLTNATKQVRAVANGGNIRRQESMQQFANRVLGKKDFPDRPVRKACKGGVMVRFKVK